MKTTFSGPIRIVRMITVVSSIAGAIAVGALISFFIGLATNNYGSWVYAVMVILAVYYPFAVFIGKKSKEYQYTISIEDAELEKRFYGTRRVEYITLQPTCKVVSLRNRLVIRCGKSNLFIHKNIDRIEELETMVRNLCK